MEGWKSWRLLEGLEFGGGFGIGGRYGYCFNMCRRGEPMCSPFFMTHVTPDI